MITQVEEAEAALVSAAGRTAQLLRGKLRAGGRRPWLAQRFATLLTRP